MTVRPACRTVNSRPRSRIRLTQVRCRRRLFVAADLPEGLVAVRRAGDQREAEIGQPAGLLNRRGGLSSMGDSMTVRSRPRFIRHRVAQDEIRWLPQRAAEASSLTQTHDCDRELDQCPSAADEGLGLCGGHQVRSILDICLCRDQLTK